MSGKNSRQTFLANIVQQVCAFILLITLPNILSKEDYAQVVFVVTIQGFLVLADMGLSLVYTRVLPVVLVSGNAHQVKEWDATVSTLGVLSSIIFSFFAAIIFFKKYSDFHHSVIIFLLPAGLFLVSFYTTRATISANFGEYRRLTSVRALSSLVAVPLAVVGGLNAWFWSQLLAVLLTIFYIGREFWQVFGRIDWVLVKKNILEGLTLCATTAAWLQLVNFARLYAGIFYSPEMVAHVGVASAAYQSLSALLTSIFLPMAVSILRRIGSGDPQTFNFMAKVLSKTVWWVFAAAIILGEATPYILGLIFPAYRFDRLVLLIFILGIVFYPFFILLGNCLIGKKKSGVYFILIVISIFVSVGVSVGCDYFYDGMGAACGQFVGLMVFTVLLWLTTRNFIEYRTESSRGDIDLTLLKIISILVGYIFFRVTLLDFL